jgi:predicted MPP superfamily phosphohydrolase
MIRGIARAVGVLAGAGALLLAWASLIERNAYVLRRFDVPVLPAGSDPVTVLHLSDLHMAPWQHRKQEWIRSLAALRPDFVVDTGDNLGHAQGIDGIRSALELFRGTPGAFVWGSNDYFGPRFKNPLRYFRSGPGPTQAEQPLDRETLERYLAGLGWTDLDNRAERVEVAGLRLELFGTDDPHRDFDRLDVVSAAIDDLRDEDDEKVDLVVGVTHAPYQRVLDSFVTHDADLILAGHTHGGQLCVPGYGALVTNCDIPREQVKGLSLWSHARRVAWLHVSAGLGTSIYAPVRFACRPEATLLTLTAVE